MQPSNRVCRVSGRSFIVPPALQNFLQKLTGLNPELGRGFPAPSVSPAEQLRIISTYGNVYHLFHGKSAVSGKELLTRFRPQEGYRIVRTEEFWGEEIDNTGFGRAYDFSRPFREQFNELLHTAYLLPLNSGSIENSEYVNSARNVRNSYLSFVIFNCEDCLYCYDIQGSTGCTACFSVRDCLYCYECVEAHRCYECFYSTAISDCRECIACSDCRSCSRCIGCTGLSHEDCAVFNQKVSPEEYEAIRARIMSGSRKTLSDLLTSCPSTALANDDILNCEDCSGAHLKNCRGMSECYGCVDCEDCGFLVGGFKSTDCWVGWAIQNQLCYQSIGSSLHNCHFCYHTYNCDSCSYSFMMNADCNCCFGCVGLIKKSYCILNRQYSRAEYFDLLPRIVRHLEETGDWGEFFPPSVAPHPYEDSWADLHIEPEPTAVIRQRGYRFLAPADERQPSHQRSQRSPTPCITRIGTTWPAKLSAALKAASISTFRKRSSSSTCVTGFRFRCFIGNGASCTWPNERNGFP